jgi:hypothetical protein
MRTRNMVAGLVRWELSWVPVEMACTSLGLWLLLAQHNWWLGSIILAVTLWISFFVRNRHYSRFIASRSADLFLGR